MKADISKDGLLTVTAETEMEEYALSKWFDAMEFSDNQCESTFCIEGYEPEPPKEAGND